jgi:glycyl-tRNA synthetase
MALGAAVQSGIIANETLAYFIGRTWVFFCRAGVDPKRMRFRQHLQHEVCVILGGGGGHIPYK